MARILFIAWHDFRHQMRQGATLVWVFVMPPMFFFFIGTVTGGFSSTVAGEEGTPLLVVAPDPGFLQEQIDLRLMENQFDTEWRSALDEQSGEVPARTLTFDDALTQKVLASEAVAVSYVSSASALTLDLEKIRVQRALYTALADLAVADAASAGELTPEQLAALNALPRIWALEVAPAGQRQDIPRGFDQAVPGILVMFTLLVLLTSGAALLAVERRQGLLRRLASAPILRGELVAGKWLGRIGLAAIQIVVALAFGTWLFDMHWGPDFFMVVFVLACWAAFCASAGLLLGSLAKTENQAVGLGVLLANLLAALGGCWWPIEVTPSWMQFVQNLLPTGWTMDALHKLISFEAGAVSALPQAALLLIATLIVGAWASRRFRYE